MSDPVTAGIAIVGTGISVYSQLKAGDAEENAAKKDAALKREQADRIEYAANRDIEIQKFTTAKQLGQMENDFASSGVSLQGSPLLALEETARMMAEERQAMLDEARFKADQLRQGADISEELGAERNRASHWNAGATILNGGAKAWSIYGDRNSYNSYSSPAERTQLYRGTL